MLIKYITLGFITLVCWQMANTSQNAVNRYTALGDLETAERLLTPMWFFTLASIATLATLALVLLYDLKKLDK